MRKPRVPLPALLAALLLVAALLPSVVALRAPEARRLQLSPRPRAQDAVLALLECDGGATAPSCRADLERLVERLERDFALAGPVAAPALAESRLIGSGGRRVLAYAALAPESPPASLAALRAGFRPSPGNSLHVVSGGAARRERIDSLLRELGWASALALLGAGLAVARLLSSRRSGAYAALLTGAALASVFALAWLTGLDSAGLLLAPPSLAALVAFGCTRRRERALGGETLSRALACAGPLGAVAFFSAGDARDLAAALAVGACAASIGAPLVAFLGAPSVAREATPWAERFAARLELFARTRIRWIALGTGALAALCLLGSLAPRRAPTLRGSLPRGSDARAVYDRLERSFGGSVLVQVALDPGDSLGARDASLEERVQSFQRHLEREPGVAWTRALESNDPATRELRVDALVDPDALAFGELERNVDALAARRIGGGASIAHASPGSHGSVSVLVALLAWLAGATVLAARAGRAYALAAVLPGPALALAVALGALGRTLDPIAASACALALGASTAFALDQLERLRGLLQAGAEPALAAARALRDGANPMLAALAAQTVGIALLGSRFEVVALAGFATLAASAAAILATALVSAPAFRAAEISEISTRS